jgi:hypothetical protein
MPSPRRSKSTPILIVLAFTRWYAISPPEQATYARMKITRHVVAQVTHYVSGSR